LSRLIRGSTRYSGIHDDGLGEEILRDQEEEKELQSFVELERKMAEGDPP